MNDDLDRLAADLDNAGAKMAASAVTALHQAAAAVRDTAKAAAPKRTGRYAASITYDVAGLAAEIGPEGDDGLGRFLEFGTVHMAPRPHLISALDRPADQFTRALEEAVDL